MRLAYTLWQYLQHNFKSKARVKTKRNITRLVIQWGLFIFLTALWTKVLFNDSAFVDFEACCPMGGLQSLITFITNGSLACTMEGMQVVMGALLAVGTMFFSKLFCGYICPIGTITDGLDKLGKRFNLPKYEITGKLDIALRSLKYILLFLTVHYTMQSNDLFCKLFDPYYAVATGYGEETNFLYATIALIAVLAGAIFLRQFWCRYLCPLGALSNMFKYFYVFIAVAIVAVILYQLEVANAFDIILGIACTLGLTFEIIGLKRKAAVQVVKVVRHPHVCIDCGLCTKNCPQGIKVDEMTSVNHPDCNLCAECITSCPKDGAIGINGSSKFTWLPALITVILVMVGLILGSKMEIPTVDKSWGDEGQIARAETFEMKGIKNVKCYGSSITFVNQMQKVKGVIGAKTYVGEHHVILSYDPTLISAEQVRKSIFKPTDIDINTPKDDDVVVLYDLKVENYFDELDRVFVANTLKNMKSVFGFQTFYEQPIKVRIYGDTTLTADSLAYLIENMDLVYKTPEKTFSSKDLYSVSSAIQNDTVYSGIYLKSLKFKAFNTSLNKRKDYDNSQLEMLKIPIISFPRNEQKMQYVANYLSHTNKNVVGVRSVYNETGPNLYIIYVKEKTSAEEIKDQLSKDSIMITFSNGTTKEIRMPYGFNIK